MANISGAMKEDMARHNSNDLLDLVRSARESYYEAREMKCTCSGFVIQYEGGCCCEKRTLIADREETLWELIDKI